MRAGAAASWPLFITALLALGWMSHAAETLEVLDAVREVKALSYRTHVTTSIVIKNVGKAPVDAFIWCDRAAENKHSAAFEAGLRQADGTSVRLFGKKTVVPGTPVGGICLELALPSPLAKGKELNLVVVGVYVGLLAPYPAAAPAGSPLRVLFKGDAAILVPYPVHKQSIKLDLGLLLDVDPVPGFELSRTATSVTISSKRPTPAMSSAPFDAHVETGGMFAVATRVKRRITVESNGDALVDEEYTIEHKGYKLEGMWSRLEYMKNPRGYGAASVNAFHATPLPLEARDIYFRDGIGNISTSVVQEASGVKVAMLAPRHLLVGGWSTDFKFGYRHPSAVGPGHASGTNMVAVRFGPSITDLTVEDLEVEVILPPGSNVVDAQLSGNPAKPKMSVTFDFLSTVSRPVVTWRQAKFVPEANPGLHLIYKRGGFLAERSTLLMATGFALLVGMRLTRRFLASKQ